MINNIKLRLVKVGKKQTEVIKALREKGINTYPAEFSFAINGVINSKRAELLIEEASKIISEWEK